MNDNAVAIPTYIGYAPQTDGKVGEQIWLRAHIVTDFLLAGSSTRASQRTEVKLCYDRTYFYIAFECFEDSMDAVSVNFTEDDGLVWLDDSIEIFISPYSVAGPSKCHQFIVNAAGAKAYMRPDWVNENENWRAAVARANDRWLAEIAIPFEMLRPLGRNEDCWRINFCRNEHPHNEKSCWVEVESSFNEYSNFGFLIPPAAPFQFTSFRGSLVSLDADQSAPLGVQDMTGEPKNLTPDYQILPEPQEVHHRISKSAFQINSKTRIAVCADANEDDLFTADSLNSTIEELAGFRLQIICSSREHTDFENIIVIGETERNDIAGYLCDRDEIRMPKSRFGFGAYAVDVLSDRIVIFGSSTVDTFYGVQTLKQFILHNKNGSLYVPALNVHDYPRFNFRGVHLLACRDALAYITKLIDRVLAPMKINHIILQTDKIAWNCHPELTDPDNSMPREDVIMLIDHARRNHITVTPLVQSPGHLEWAFRDGHNLEIAEDPENPYCYCMANSKSFEFIMAIMDEAIELFGQPQYFHAGRDEFDMLGKMPLHENCKAIGKEHLYYQDTLRIHEHLRLKGCRMMMWGDVLSKPGYRKIIDDLPKDIVICDWHYSPSASYPSVDFFQSHGFRVLGCTWYDPRNINSFARYGSQRAISGMLQTTWTGFKSEKQVFDEHPEQIYANLLSAAWSWNPLKPNYDNFNFRPKKTFDRLWNGYIEQIDRNFCAINIDQHCNISRVDSGRSLGWLGCGRGNDLRAIPEGLVCISDIPYKILPSKIDYPAIILLGGKGIAEKFPERVNAIMVEAKLKAIHFLHSCAFGTNAAQHVASYIIHFADGTSDEIKLIYEQNICAWDDQISRFAYDFAWTAKRQDGRTIMLCDLKWANPKPELEISSIDFVSADTQCSPFVVALTGEK